MNLPLPKVGLTQTAFPNIHFKCTMGTLSPSTVRGVLIERKCRGIGVSISGMVTMEMGMQNREGEGIKETAEVNRASVHL